MKRLQSSDLGIKSSRTARKDISLESKYIETTRDLPLSTVLLPSEKACRPKPHTTRPSPPRDSLSPSTMLSIETRARSFGLAIEMEDQLLARFRSRAHWMRVRF